MNRSNNVNFASNGKIRVGLISSYPVNFIKFHSITSVLNDEFLGIKNSSLSSSFFFSCLEMFRKMANFESHLIISKVEFVMSLHNASSKDTSRFILINSLLPPC